MERQNFAFLVFNARDKTKVQLPFSVRSVTQGYQLATQNGRNFGSIRFKLTKCLSRCLKNSMHLKIYCRNIIKRSMYLNNTFAEMSSQLGIADILSRPCHTH